MLVDARRGRHVAHQHRIHPDERARSSGYSRLPVTGQLLPTASVRQALEAAMSADGYKELCWRAGEVSGVRGMLATGYRRWYCFQTADETSAPLSEWTGEGLPPRQRIICKGADGELVSPALAGKPVR